MKQKSEEKNTRSKTRYMDIRPGAGHVVWEGYTAVIVHFNS